VSIRYLKITLIDGTRFILRITSESPNFIHGFEVNAEGDEVVPAGYDRRHRTIERGLIKKSVPMRMNPTYATLEAVPREHSTIKRSLDPFKDLDKRARLALRQALQSGSGAAPSEVVKKLERRGLVTRSGHVHASKEWGKTVRRWPSFWLTDTGKRIAQEIADTLYGPSSTTPKTAAQLDAEIAEVLGKQGSR